MLGSASRPRSRSLSRACRPLMTRCWPPRPGDPQYAVWSKYPQYCLMPTVDMPNEMLVERLRKVMIRHTKRQRIGGDVALALPDADCKTLWLEMSEDERQEWAAELGQFVPAQLPEFADAHGQWLSYTDIADQLWPQAAPE